MRFFRTTDGTRRFIHILYIAATVRHYVHASLFGIQVCTHLDCLMTSSTINIYIDDHTYIHMYVCVCAFVFQPTAFCCQDSSRAADSKALTCLPGLLPILLDTDSDTDTDIARQLAPCQSTSDRLDSQNVLIKWTKNHWPTAAVTVAGVAVARAQ